ncbi:hypothetical protein LB467_13180 [Salegentibacter sp. JZCK2]|uniref:inositol monophosphatase family protein n=1 Tax=Salegentibacter tibetensis TaxID=2873600 RepID=UPI001CCE53C4|nr:inositol monophosphatase family protein [Salegentibacter tibetensis]MBZ9730642.1 hypothetical protein [Salegentibacter tibetensis]
MTEIEQAIRLIQCAGKEILRYRDTHTGNRSFSQRCETESYEVLKNLLYRTGLPIVSKFNNPDFDIRKDWEEFWLVSPLLGKKSLKEGKDDFAVSIAKISRKRPVLGIIYAPADKVLFIAINNKPYKIKNFSFGENEDKTLLLQEKNLIRKPVEGFFLKILKSKNLMNKKTEKFLEDFKAYQEGSLKEVVDQSPLKLCGIAEGKYNYYPHLKPVPEWEIAAFDALITASGNMMTKKDGILPLEYNTEKLKLPAFIAKSNFQFDSTELNP